MNKFHLNRSICHQLKKKTQNQSDHKRNASLIVPKQEKNEYNQTLPSLFFL